MQSSQGAVVEDAGHLERDNVSTGDCYAIPADNHWPVDTVYTFQKAFIFYFNIVLFSNTGPVFPRGN
jgi:hypothetical protein